MYNKNEKFGLKKMFSIFILLITLTSCGNITKKNINYVIEKENDYYVLYLNTKTDKLKIDKSEGKIENVEFIKDYIIYDWISTGGIIKKVYDFKKGKEITKLNFGIFTKDKNFIYSCRTGGYGPGYLKVFDLLNLTERNISKELGVGKNGIIVEKCKYKDKKIFFSLFNNIKGKIKGNYSYDFITKKLEIQ